MDRAHRVLGASWWQQEQITAEAVEALGTEPVDALITPDVPASVPVRSMIRLEPYTEVLAGRGRVMLRRAVQGDRPEVTFSGHCH